MLQFPSTIELSEEQFAQLAAVNRDVRLELTNGLRLGWLINPKTQTVEIYRPDREVELLQSPIILFGEGVLPGFILDLQAIWS